MACTKDEFVEGLMRIHQNAKKIQDLTEQRRVEEKALVEEYRVDECNKKRNDLAIKYANLQKVLVDENTAIQASLSEV